MIEWSQQHCGVHLAPIAAVKESMPEIGELILTTFPEDPELFTWDIKVHMLMPLQYPCIPNWHCDAVPRNNGIQQYEIADRDLPLYLWVSGPPLTQFEGGYLTPRVWHRYTTQDKHRGLPASEFCWRGLIRATHVRLQKPNLANFLRRHSQVYLDAANYHC